MTHDWNEAEGKCVPLPPDMPDVFRIYLQWAYSDRVHCAPPQKDNFEAWRPYQNLLVRAYILGDKLLDTNFQDAIMDILIDFSREVDRYLLRQASLVFGYTLEESPLLTLIVDFATHVRFTPSIGQMLREDTDFRACFNEEACVAVAIELIENTDTDQNPRKIIAPYVRDTCLYHLHMREGKPCYKEALDLTR